MFRVDVGDCKAEPAASWAHACNALEHEKERNMDLSKELYFLRKLSAQRREYIAQVQRASDHQRKYIVELESRNHALERQLQGAENPEVFGWPSLEAQSRSPYPLSCGMSKDPAEPRLPWPSAAETVLHEELGTLKRELATKLNRIDEIQAQLAHCKRQRDSSGVETQEADHKPLPNDAADDDGTLSACTTVRVDGVAYGMEEATLYQSNAPSLPEEVSIDEVEAAVSMSLEHCHREAADAQLQLERLHRTEQQLMSLLRTKDFRDNLPMAPQAQPAGMTIVIGEVVVPLTCRPLPDLRTSAEGLLDCERVIHGVVEGVIEMAVLGVIEAFDASRSENVHL